MAVAYVAESHTIPGSSTNSLVISKPTGVADGDLMLALVFGRPSSMSGDITPPAGWTLLQTATYTYTKAWLYSREASSEGASYTFTITSSTDRWGGGIVAFSGAEVDDSGYVGGNSIMTITGDMGMDATDAGRYLVALACGYGNQTFSGWAVATSSPTWTEVTEASNSYASLGVAHASRPETTDPGDWTAVASGTLSSGALLGVTLKESGGTPPPLARIMTPMRGIW